MFPLFTDFKKMIGSPKKKKQNKCSPKHNEAIRKYKKSREHKNKINSKPTNKE